MYVCSTKELKTNLRHQLSCIYLRFCHPGGTARTTTFYACQIILKTRQVVVVVSAWVIYFILSLSFFLVPPMQSVRFIRRSFTIYIIVALSWQNDDSRGYFSSRRFASAMRQAYAYIPPYTQQCLGLTFDLYYI